MWGAPLHDDQSLSEQGQPELALKHTMITKCDR